MNVTETKKFLHSCRQSLKDAVVLHASHAYKLIELVTELNTNLENCERQRAVDQKQIEDLKKELEQLKINFLERITKALE